MFAILMMIVVYLVLGFLYAWVMNMVSREDVSVVRGAAILLITAVAAAIVGAVLPEGLDRAIILSLGTLVNFVCLITLTKLIAQLSWKHAAISAAVYTALLFVFGLVMVGCALAVA